MSTAKFSTWLNPDGTENYKCRAWVNFNGTGTVAIRAAGNVTSITDNGTGDYTVNFTTALPDANYAPVFGNDNGSSAANASPKLGLADGFTPQTTSIRITNDRDSATGFLDTAFAFVAIFR
jgi:hypothetical protein